MFLRGPVVAVLLLIQLAVTGQSATLPPALQFTRTVTLPLSKAQVAASVRAAWDNSFGLEEGASFKAQDSRSGTFTGVAHFAFLPQDLNGREQARGNIQYQVTIQAENGSCLLRVHAIVHRGNAGAKGGPIDLGTMREGAPEDLRVPGMGHAPAVHLYNDATNATTDHLERLMARFESTLRERAAP